MTARLLLAALVAAAGSVVPAASASAYFCVIPYQDLTGDCNACETAWDAHGTAYDTAPGLVPERDWACPTP